MRQAAFEAANAERWRGFRELLDRAERAGRGRRAPAPDDPELAAFPERYRAVCRDLALARARRYGPALIERLNALALEGHRQLYRRDPGFVRGMLVFLLDGFPRRVREEWRLVALSAALFLGPAAALFLAVRAAPELVYSVLSAEALADFEAMYDPANERLGPERGAATDLRMFGFYVWNNVSVGFRTFAGGVAFGLGSAAALVFNGVLLGTVAAHLLGLGFATPFFSFVVGHASFELTAIVLAGAAGLRLGAALIAPGPRPRVQALREAATRAVPLVYGVVAMLVVAAVIEAFWSSRASLPPLLKYGTGAVLWALVGLYLMAGRGREAQGASG